MQLVELKSSRVNEKFAAVKRDNVDDDDDDDDYGKDDEEGGAFPLNGTKLSRGGYLHIIPRNSRMCLIRRYLSARPAATVAARFNSPFSFSTSFANVRNNSSVFLP